MHNGLTESELTQLELLFKSNPNITKAILYGSRAKGTFKPFSDVDIALMGNNLLQRDITHLLNKIHNSNFPYQVDLVLFKSLKNQDLIDHIQRVGVIIYLADANSTLLEGY